MKFSDLLLYIFLIGVLSSVCFGEYKSIKKISDVCCECRNKVIANKFISQTFIKTCEGKGFSSLNEWQQTCKALWKLEYIAWSDAEDFMEVDYSNSNKKLLYGKWIGSNSEGEIFCRSFN